MTSRAGGRRAGTRGVRLAGAALLAAALAAGRLGAQEVECDPGDTEIRALEFHGNRAFGDDALAAAVVATPSSAVFRTRISRALLGWTGQRRCIQRTEIVLDRARLVLFYKNRGFPDVSVDTAVTRDGRAIRVRFDIVEGRPIRVDTLRVTWLDTATSAARVVRNLPVRRGAAFDKVAVSAARDTVLARLGNSGYPSAQVLAGYETYTDSYSAKVTLDILPGPRTRIGEVEIEATPRAGSTQKISDDVARRLSGLREGAVYRDRDVAAARRNLYLTEAYQAVSISRDTSRPTPDSVMNLRIRAAEGFMRAARLSGGYGTIDCFRAQGDLTNRNVQAFGLATRLELTGRLSKIGRGSPLGTREVGERLCPQIEEDPYSSRLNYYGGVTLRQPTLSGVPNILPSITLYSQRASEYRAFLRTVPIGGVATYSWTPRPRLPQLFSYSIERGSTTAAPAVFCAAFNACQEDDRERLQQRLRSATLGWSIARNRANDAVNPTGGSVARLDLRHASKATLSDEAVRFNRALGDVSWYLPGGAGNTIALRLRLGGVFGTRLSFEESAVPNFVPQQERLFAGGSQTVRGFRQNELGPLVYVTDVGIGGIDAVPATDSLGDPIVVEGKPVHYLRPKPESEGSTRAVPTGGNTLVVTNVEYRLRSPFLPELLQWVGFLDAGNVWDRRTGSDAITLFATPGFGVRVASPFGPIRVDLGYNPHKPVPGALFVEEVDAETRPLYCVSPDNRVGVVDLDEGDGIQWAQVNPTQRCPSSYQPGRRRGFRAWNISLSIAQAF